MTKERPYLRLVKKKPTPMTRDEAIKVLCDYLNNTRLVSEDEVEEARKCLEAENAVRKRQQR